MGSTAFSGGTSTATLTRSSMPCSIATCSAACAPAITGRTLSIISWKKFFGASCSPNRRRLPRLLLLSRRSTWVNGSVVRNMRWPVAFAHSTQKKAVPSHELADSSLTSTCTRLATIRPAGGSAPPVIGSESTSRRSQCIQMLLSGNIKRCTPCHALIATSPTSRASPIGRGDIRITCNVKVSQEQRRPSKSQIAAHRSMMSARFSLKFVTVWCGVPSSCIQLLLHLKEGHS